jgi:ribosomal protein L37E
MVNDKRMIKCPYCGVVVYEEDDGTCPECGFEIASSEDI